MTAAEMPVWFSLLAQFVLAMIATMSFGIAFQVPRRHHLACGLVGVEENGVARRVNITTGLTGSGVTEVLSGLSAGEKLITVGQAYLVDGSAVRVVGGGN